MSKKDFCIGIPCGTNSESFSNFLIKSIERTVSKRLSYSYLISINKQGVDREKIVEGLDVDIEFIERHSDKSSSLGHADSLNMLLQKFDTKFAFLIDSDVAFLKKSWDIDLLDELQGNVAMIGSEYHKTDGKTVGRPNVITCAINVDVMKSLNVDFTPSLKTIVLDEKTSITFGGKPGEKAFLDTGCDMISQLIESGYDTRIMKIVSPRYVDTHHLLKFLEPGERGEEYHLNSQPICTHIGRSLTRNFNSDPIIVSWKNKVETWIDGKI